MASWVDVPAEGDSNPEPMGEQSPSRRQMPPPPGQSPPPPPRHAAPSSPFGGIAPVDKIAYVDSDDPVELRYGSNPTTSVPRPPEREKPQPRRQQGREKKWLPADEPTAPRPSRGTAGKIIRAFIALVLFGGLTFGAWTLITAYQSSVFTPTPAPSPAGTPNTEMSPAPESGLPSAAPSPSN